MSAQGPPDGGHWARSRDLCPVLWLSHPWAPPGTGSSDPVINLLQPSICRFGIFASFSSLLAVAGVCEMFLWGLGWGLAGSWFWWFYFCRLHLINFMFSQILGFSFFTLICVNSGRFFFGGGLFYILRQVACEEYCPRKVRKEGKNDS